MSQRFRHVVVGMTPAEVAAHVEAHRGSRWTRRPLTVSVRGDRLKASVPTGRLVPPPVLKARLREHPDGTEVVGEVHRRAAALFTATYFLAGLAAIAFGGVLLGEEAVGGGVVFVLLGVVFLLITLALSLTGLLVRGLERGDIAAALDRFLRG